MFHKRQIQQSLLNKYETLKYLASTYRYTLEHGFFVCVIIEELSFKLVIQDTHSLQFEWVFGL